jgi:hypothetical protein
LQQIRFPQQRRRSHRLVGLFRAFFLTSGWNLIMFPVELRAQEPPALRLSLRRAVEIALSPEGSARYQLAGENVKQAETRSVQARAALLRDFDAYAAYESQTRNLEAVGLRFGTNIPGAAVPTFVGPFSVVDVRSNVRQSVIHFSAVRRYQSSRGAMRVHRNIYSLSIRDLLKTVGDDPRRFDAQTLRKFVLERSRRTGWGATKSCITGVRMLLPFRQV